MPQYGHLPMQVYDNGTDIQMSCCGCTVVPLPLPLPFGSAIVYLYIGSSIVVLTASILDPCMPVCDPIAAIVENGELRQVCTNMAADEMK